MNNLRKDIRDDQEGGIEGLPLQLLLMVLVAGVGSAVILGWMGGLEAPSALGSVHSSESELVLLDEDGDGMYSLEEVELCITVLDMEGEPVPGTTVVLEGCGVRGSGGDQPHAITDAQGRACFAGLSLERTGGSIGFVTVTAAKSGMPSTKSISVPVVCG